MRSALVRFFAMAALLWCCCFNASGQELKLPERRPNAPGGKEFAGRIASLDMAAREQQILSEVLSGNVPQFLRMLCRVEATVGSSNRCTFYVIPDYLAVGSDQDYLLMPVSPATAQRIADATDCILPTRKMVDQIYGAAVLKMSPAPIPPSGAMTSVPVFSNHNEMVYRARIAGASTHPQGTLVAGHKKDLVITARLVQNPGKVAIYGWHKTNGSPIQPLYLGHSATWVDYSQCTRLVSREVLLNGKSTRIDYVLRDQNLCSLLSDEGAIASARYPTNPIAALSLTAVGTKTKEETPFTGFKANRFFDEQIASFTIAPEVRVHINKPAPNTSPRSEPGLLILYALPNGNTIEQTIGRVLKAGDDWHYDIQHIGAQTRFLRGVLTNRTIAVAYLENALKSWPAWRKKHGDSGITNIVSEVSRAAALPHCKLVLTGHSGGGSFTFGYLNSVTDIPADVERIAFLDSNYAYTHSLHHDEKLATWLKADPTRALCVFAYNDAVALLDGKSFVSKEGGTWGKTHEMQADLARRFDWTVHTNGGFETYSALNGRIQFLLKENPRREILHTVQVERNGFIHAMLTGTELEGKGYAYYGPRAYSRLIQPE